MSSSSFNNGNRHPRATDIHPDHPDDDDKAKLAVIAEKSPDLDALKVDCRSNETNNGTTCTQLGSLSTDTLQSPIPRNSEPVSVVVEQPRYSEPVSVVVVQSRWIGRTPPLPPGMHDHHCSHREVVGGGGGGGGGGFQPSPSFRAPPNIVHNAGPNQAHPFFPNPYWYARNNNNMGGFYWWSKEEDMRLKFIANKYINPQDWDPIAKEHNCGRSAKECHERWIRYLKPGVRRENMWTDYEDAIVMEVVTSSSEQPFTRWSDLAKRLPGRLGKGIRDRWVNHLNPNINRLPFSRQDDLLLWDGRKKLGKRWTEISTKYFNSSRSENQIKNRWYSASFKKFISNEFGLEAYSGDKMKNNHPKKKKKDGGKPLSSVSPSKRTQPLADEISQCEEVYSVSSDL